jgi:NAD(P)-dependent dehydrogenase (short-subunit alcohol dehydrogenase family)
MKERSNRTYLVVGAAGNLGPAWCETILKDGHNVLAIGKNLEIDLFLQSLFDKYGDQIVFIEQDLLDNYCEKLVQLKKNFSIHGVVLNLGIDSPPGTGKKGLLDYSYSDWTTTLNLNIAALVTFLNWIVPSLVANSSVVLIGSIYGIVSPDSNFYSHFNDGEGSTKNPAYGASKGALISLCRQYATHLAKAGIRVNILTLGGVKGDQDLQFIEKISARIPQGRMAEISDITGPLRFLLSDESSYITGHNLVADGGFLAL